MYLIKIEGITGDELIRMVALYCSVTLHSGKNTVGSSTAVYDAHEFEKYIKKGYNK